LQTPIAAIISDYDGTLCPTNSVRSKDATIPEDLEQVLWQVSQMISVCIISSKDYHFLHPRTKFARILSCILGFETLTLKIHNNEGRNPYKNIGSNNTEDGCGNTLSCIEDKHLMLSDNKTLRTNSGLLAMFADKVSQTYKDIMVEREFTNEGKILAGITMDYRHLVDWRSYKEKSEPLLKQMILEDQSSLSADSYKLNVQTYSSHPFMDAYVTKCDKGIAFDVVFRKLFAIEERRERKIMYLGDSENDNPAFIKADVPIGIKSDDRLNPNLACSKHVKFDGLSLFLKRLKDNKFMFSDNILSSL
jgi:hydroxymethylpyrimidine pyrophosphatase-like HAD family hydrolase